VGKELRHALKLREQRGKDQFPVVALALNGTRLGVLEEFFGEEPVYIPLSSDAGGIEAAIDPILVALGKRDPADVAALPQSQSEPLEELVLELSDLKVQERECLRRATARARLIYEPATPGQPKVDSAQSWRLVAPIGPIEAGDLCWYLEQYAIWPSPYFKGRAQQVEEKIVMLGPFSSQVMCLHLRLPHLKAAGRNAQHGERHPLRQRLAVGPETAAPAQDPPGFGRLLALRRSWAGHGGRETGPLEPA
jgi:hypothetical protein